MNYPPSVEILIDEFAKLPGIGRKSAARLAFHIIKSSAPSVDSFLGAIVGARGSIRECSVCHNLAESELCNICQNPARDSSIVCVVSDPRDVAAIERSREYKGCYHVLHGVISPLQNIGPDDIRVKELVSRVAQGGTTEVIMATDTDVEGEATALYIARLLAPFAAKVTRLAYGIPMGGRLEYSDEITVARALEGRSLLN